MVERVECVVVGAGVVGLAIARALAADGRDVVVLEAENAFGTGVSARNSEVIHAGLYYPEDSLRARLCVAGRQYLYEYCASHGVGHRKCQKLVVATEAGEAEALDGIGERAIANGAGAVQLLDAGQALRLEPALRCARALLSPETGIIDAHGLMLAYLGDAQDQGALLALRSPLEGGEAVAGGIRLRVGGAEPMGIEARVLINAAGLGAQAVAASIAGVAPDSIPKQYLGKGSYFTLAGKAPFARLIYPVPGHGHLGVHLTIDMGGQAKFGPNMEWVEALNYDVDAATGEAFYGAVRRYWPGLEDGALGPAYAGIRPKIHGPGEAQADFMIQGPEAHGVAGLISLFGIESPGLTASLAIGRMVATLVSEF